MIEVRLVLNGGAERALFDNFMQHLEAMREQAAEAIKAHVRAQYTQQPEAQTAAPVAQDDADVVVGHIQPNPATGETESFRRVPAEKIDFPELEKVVMTYLQKHGVPSTREKIATFGYPKLDQVPEEKWGELKAIFEAAL